MTFESHNSAQFHELDEINRPIVEKFNMSVIIPCYNTSNTIDECLSSVFSQEDDSFRIEVICIDDGSTDDTLRHLEKWKGKKSNMVVIQQKNCGSGPARNRGISIANGEFISFMDGDDKYPCSDTLKKLYGAAKNNNVNICGGSLLLVDRGKRITDFHFPSDGYKFSEEKKMSYSNYQFDYGYWRFIYSLDFLKVNGITFPDYRRYQDTLFFIKAMTLSKEFFAINQVTYQHYAGYKRLMWDNRKIIDMLSAMKDIFIWSKNNRMSKLHYYNYEHLRDHIPAISLFIKNDSIEKKYRELLASIDVELLNEYNIRDINCISVDYVISQSNIIVRIKREIRKRIRRLMNDYD